MRAKSLKQRCPALCNILLDKAYIFNNYKDEREVDSCRAKKVIRSVALVVDESRIKLTF